MMCTPLILFLKDKHKSPRCSLKKNSDGIDTITVAAWIQIRMHGNKMALDRNEVS